MNKSKIYCATGLCTRYTASNYEKCSPLHFFIKLRMVVNVNDNDIRAFKPYRLFNENDRYLGFYAFSDSLR